MTEGKPYPPWPGGDDRIVVEEMLRDRTSGQWYECREFVKRLVQVQAKNIPQDHGEDLVQDAMMRVDKHLPTFRYQCKLSTWLFVIVRSCIIDAHRKFTRAGQLMAPPGDPNDDVDREYDDIDANTTKTAEEICIMHDDLGKALAALQEYVSTHANPVRNGPRDAQRDCSKQAENDRRCLFVLTAGQREPRKKGGTSEEPSITSDKKHEIVGDRYENAQRDPLDERTYVEDELHRKRSRLKRPANRGPGQTRVRAHRR